MSETFVVTIWPCQLDGVERDVVVQAATSEDEIAVAIRVRYGVRARLLQDNEITHGTYGVVVDDSPHTAVVISGRIGLRVV